MSTVILLFFDGVYSKDAPRCVPHTKSTTMKSTTNKLNLPPLKLQTGIGYSPLTEKVYLGKQNPKKRMWIGEKKDITNSFLQVLNEFLGVGQVREIDVLNEKDNALKETHLLLQIKKDPASIERAIKYLQKQLK